MNNVDKHVYSHSVIILLIAFSVPVIGHRVLSLYDGRTVAIIEQLQSICLLTGAVFTWCYIKPLRCDPDKSVFWLWSIVWWLMLFGRGVSWGRDYFPGQPKIYFRVISIVLIGAMLLMLCLPAIRREIVRRFRQEPIPLWDIILMVVYFIIVDTVEHQRFLSFLFVYDPQRQNLIEELFELPFIFSLFSVVWYLQHNELRKKPVKAMRQAEYIP